VAVKRLSAFTSEDKTKLASICDCAESNNIADKDATALTGSSDTTLHYHSADRARTNHTGTQAASTISDFDTEVSNNSAVVANTAKISFPEAPIDGIQYSRKDGEWEATDSGPVKVYYAEAGSESPTTSAWTNRVTLTLPSNFEAGNYFIEVNYGYRIDSATEKFQARARLDGVDLGNWTHYEAPQDAYNKAPAFRRFKCALTSGTHTITLDYGTSGTQTAYIWDASITVTRIDIQEI